MKAINTVSTVIQHAPIASQRCSTCFAAARKISGLLAKLKETERERKKEREREK